MDDPLVTIIVCSRNRGARLHLMLDKLSEIKSRHDWDVLFVDNASTDNTAHVLTSYTGLGDRLHYAMADKIGLGAARDHAWRLARGEILAFTDDDCYPMPNFVDAIANVFAQHPNLGLVGGRILLYDPLDIPVATDTRDVAKELPPYSYLETGSYQGANMSIRKSVLEQIGGFDGRLGAGTRFPCEDIDVAAAISWAGLKTRFDPLPVVYHHHGRRKADLAAVWKGYDAGRGAYYAKYLMRKDSRRTYLEEWTRRVMKHGSYSNFVQFTRELRSGMAFAFSVGRADFVFLSAPLAFVALLILPVIILTRRVLRIRYKGFVKIRGL